MTRVAAVDCGTNSIRLLIADVMPNDLVGSSGLPSLRDVERRMRLVRLGQGVDATGQFAPEALERTFAAVDDYAEIIRASGAERVRFVATSASRDVLNRGEFVSGVLDRLGVEPEVITGAQEAELSFAGAASMLDHCGSGPALVVDLGGGSTEFVLGELLGGRTELLGVCSVNLGCVRFTERYLSGDPPTHAQQAAAVAEAQAVLSGVAAELPLTEAERIVGVAGTVTTVTAQALSLPAYLPERLHGAELPIPQLVAACRQLTGMRRAERAALPFMHPGRVDVIGAGALLWQTILTGLCELSKGRLSTAITSEHDILDGLALSLV